MNTPKRWTPELFWDALDRSGDCWLWTRQLDRKGYGRFSYQGRFWRAHRLAWELTYGAIPSGLVVCHRCDVRNCCRLSHLFIGTVADNNEDRKSKGKYALGASVHNAKLSEEQVREIKRRLGIGAKKKPLAREFGVNPRCIDFIATGRNWGHV